MDWNLSFQLGTGYNFTKESILACAPPTSGVYGLFNCALTIFIGESANIRDTLLRHESETDFRHLKPTAFTFELCAPELRKLWAAELIAKVHPLIKSEAALREFRSQSDGPPPTAPDQGGWELGTISDSRDAPVPESEERPNSRKTFQIKRIPAAMVAAMLVATAGVMFYFGMPSQIEVGLGLPNTQLDDTAGYPTNSNAGTILVTTSTPGNDTVQVSEAHSGANKSGVQAKMGPAMGAARSSEFRKEWSVQISAAPAKEIADRLVRQLKTKGYDGYSVQTKIKGQDYYRVRVGHFNTREQAESVRQSLARLEGFRDAYLPAD